MVRLKKKRFIVIDYGIVPTAIDIAAAAVNPNIACPAGAGKQKCVTADCPKRGVPVLLYDSDPSEPASLYLRSGLCFTCQRILNEKRRTQRKRKSDSVAAGSGANHHSVQHAHRQHMHEGASGIHPHALSHSVAHGHGMAPVPISGADPSSFHHMDTVSAAAAKRFRLNGDIVDLSPDAIIINGPLDGTKHHGPGYGFSEIGVDLMCIFAEAAKATERLLGGTIPSQRVATPSAPPAGGASVTTTAGQNDNAVAVAAAAAAAAAVAAGGKSGAVDAATAAAIELTASPHTMKEPVVVTNLTEQDAPVQPQVPPMQPTVKEEIPALYEKAFLSLSRAIYLLSQWKASRDAHDAEESARKAALEVPHIPLSSVSDHGGLAVNADAVAAAAAAAVASASAVPPPPPPPPAVQVAEEAAVAVVTAAHAPVEPAAPPPTMAVPMMAPTDPAAISVAVPDVIVEVASAMNTIKTDVPAHVVEGVAGAGAIKPEVSSQTVQDNVAPASIVPANVSADGSPSGMIPLLLAAEGRKEDSTPKVKEEANGTIMPPQQVYSEDKPQAVAATDVPAGIPPGSAAVNDANVSTS